MWYYLGNEFEDIIILFLCSALVRGRGGDFHILAVFDAAYLGRSDGGGVVSVV